MPTKPPKNTLCDCKIPNPDFRKTESMLKSCPNKATVTIENAGGLPWDGWFCESCAKKFLERKSD